METDGTLEPPSDETAMEVADTGSAYVGWHGDVLAGLHGINEKQKERISSLVRDIRKRQTTAALALDRPDEH